MSLPVAKRLADYAPPQFWISSVELTFELNAQKTVVTSRMQIERNGEHEYPLVLDGEGIGLDWLKVDGVAHDQYFAAASSLTINNVPNSFELSLQNHFDPSANTSLEGLYVSGEAFCTQCEAEGFRKITYFLDRPDVMATFSVRMEADKAKYPYLLSNGNKVASGDLANGRHFAQWQDPYNKPAYLFALVAGDFDVVSDNYVTQSGRHVDLQLFVDKGNAYRGQHALDSLKKSMKWDEQVFGLEYDLDIYMIVAVDFFNMGAMENKGLNVFNSKFVLADPASATDDDYFNIESIIAHEYFHNWTGNRVTCRDWFQLSLKEGLTVFRDQQFSSDMSSAVVNRIGMIKVIRGHQFAEDASPMAHPIRPEEVIEMNNFYTVTVYDKGAEVIRMMHTLLGQAGFRKGMDLYFERHDGQAVTCDDFVAAMQDANDFDMSLFKRWYSQSGTPELIVKQSHDLQSGAFTLSLEQNHKPTADQQNKQNLHIPVRYEIFHIDTSGNKQVVQAGVKELKTDTASIQLTGVDKPVTSVVLGDFSAPVKLHFERSDSALIETICHADDGFARWDASQTLYSDLIWHLADKTKKVDEVTAILNTIVSSITDQDLEDHALTAELITLPSFDSLAEQRDSLDVDKLHSAKSQVGKELAKSIESFAQGRYQEIKLGDYRFATEDVAKRKLKNRLLAHLVLTGKHDDLAVSAFANANNMTDKLGALKSLQQRPNSVFDDLMMRFESEWHNDVLVVDKWFGLHAGAEREDILSMLDLLTAHASYSFENPNRVRAVVGSFAFTNVQGFHAIDGTGYQYVMDIITKLNEINPQVASRLITPFLQWKKFDTTRKDIMKGQLVRLADNPKLSADLFEKVTKSLSS